MRSNPSLVCNLTCILDMECCWLGGYGEIRDQVRETRWGCGLGYRFDLDDQLVMWAVGAGKRVI